MTHRLQLAPSRMVRLLPRPCLPHRLWRHPLGRLGPADRQLLPLPHGILCLPGSGRLPRRGTIPGGGLYEKSRRLEAGETAGLTEMLAVWPRSDHQVFFMGVLLLLLFLLWMRAAVINYALFFGIRPFPGADEVLPMLLLTPTGWGMLLVVSVLGALFAAYAFAATAFSIRMLLNEDIDAFFAMGISIALVWNNLAVMLAWGAIVVSFFLVCVLTALLGLIVVFPVLGHASWHAYRAIRRQGRPNQRVFFSPA
jgi:uncharacterized membrane protein